MASNKINQYQEIIQQLYNQNPYHGFSPQQQSNIRKINEPLFEFLIETLEPKLILELGSWKGASALKMAQILKKNRLKDSVIICVDTWLGSAESWLNKENKEWGFESLKIVHGFPTIYKTFLSNVINNKSEHKIIPFPQTTENAAVVFRRLNLKFDLIYLDAAPEYQAVWNDLENYWDLLNPQGILFGNGYSQKQGITKAVNDFVEKLNLKIYSKLGKYVLVKSEQNLDSYQTVGLKLGVIKSGKELITLGLNARKEKNEQKALEYFQKAISNYPKIVLAYVEAGKSLRELQRLEEAKEKFLQAIQLNPNELGALMGYGEIAALEWQLEIALEKFERVIKRHPNYSNAYVQAAIVLRNLKRFAEAEKIADLGLSKASTNIDTRNLLREKGLALAGQVKLKEASDILKDIVRNGGNFYLFFDAAILLSTQKLFDQAILFLQSNLPFLKEYSDNWVLIQRRIEFMSRSRYVHEKQLEKAKNNQAYKILNLHPQEPVFNIPLQEFEQKNISVNKPSFFYDQFKFEKSEKLFDDLDGLLSSEKEIFSKIRVFKDGIPNTVDYGIFTIPRACFMIDWSRLPFSLDGYFIPKLITILHAFKYSQQCLIKEINRGVSCGFFLPSAGQGNYYHILTDIMPTLSVYQELGLKCPIVLPSVAKNVEQIILQALGIPKNMVMSAQETEGMVFDIGIVCPPLPLSIQTANFYKNLAPKILKQQNLTVGKSERVYISRRNSPKRPLLNEDKIEEMLAGMGFSIYYMENYTFEQQIAIMANASIVVATHGAGITNIFFCPTGTKIVELMLDKYIVSMFYSIALICGHKYYPILGKFEGSNATKDEDFVWTIDIDKVQRVVAKLLEE